MKQQALSIDGLRNAVRRMPDDALTPAREAALAHFDEHGLPTVRDEDWKYTDLATAIGISNRWLATGALADESPENVDLVANSIAEITASIDAIWLVIANGNIDDSRVTRNSGLEVSRFSEHPAPLVMERPLADLNAALLRDGLRIQISAATEKPIGLLIIDSANSDASVSQASIEIDIAPGCNAEIIEYQVSAGDYDHYANSVVTLHIGQRANSNFVRIQNRARHHVQTGRMSATLDADSKLCMTSYDLGGGLIRNDVDIDLGKPGADVVFSGLYIAGNGQHIDNHTRVDHSVGPTTSSQEYRGILNGDCRCVWNGKAIVHKGADGTDANQANHNLLLSDKAEIDTKPELEIYADDVKCSHGTTVGQLDEAALFYLRSRGLDKDDATQVLTNAFAVDIVDRAPVSAAKEAIAAMVKSRLAELIEDVS
jgi:Fe-S cluster assembly protein SufD